MALFGEEDYTAPMTNRKTIAVIGAGPAGLAAAERISAAGHDVVVYDHMPSPARKFLMAGRSGLNLTHAEDLSLFRTRYGAAQAWLAPFIERFPPQALRDWADGLGQSCFTGSSGRVFPHAMKASPLLRAWLGRLATQNVRLALRHRWTGWDAQGRLLFSTPEGVVSACPDAVVLALGGASWSRLGSDGGWVEYLPPESVAPLQPANCGFQTCCPAAFHERFHGEVLHSVVISGAGVQARGDVTITKRGIEGAPVYRVSAAWRDVLAERAPLDIRIDFRPGLTRDALAQRLDKFRARESQANRLRRLGLSAPARWLLREALEGRAQPTVSSVQNQGDGAADGLAALIKSCPLGLSGTDALDRAISTSGGVRRDAVNQALMLKARPGVFVAGEMLDWEAPTGGYLLQACFATGRAAGEGVLSWLEAGPKR